MVDGESAAAVMLSLPIIFSKSGDLGGEPVFNVSELSEIDGFILILLLKTFYLKWRFDFFIIVGFITI